MRTNLKRTLIALAAFCGAIFAIALLLQLPRKQLPHVRLLDGGEFRVIKITYTSKQSEASEHAIGSSPKAAFWVWHHLPKPLQTRIPYPNEGMNISGSSRPALSIWWAYISPRTQQPELGEADYVITTLDSGRQLKPIWPRPYDDYRQIFVNDPPTDSKHLRFRLRAWDNPVEFVIENPAYTP